jgi:hypothetical protein
MSRLNDVGLQLAELSINRVAIAKQFVAIKKT